jgi:hypothetical protein
VSRKTLYKYIPELKQSGTPQGFPMMKGKEAQKFWCRKTAHDVLVNRELERVRLEQHQR